MSVFSGSAKRVEVFWQNSGMGQGILNLRAIGRFFVVVLVGISVAV